MARPPYPNEHNYAVEQERLRHDDAVMHFGEMTACVLMWSIRDFEANRVDRCSQCYLPYGMITDAYKQSTETKCSNCYGTTFEGGIRAILYRPALWAEDIASEEMRSRGHTTVAAGSVQVTSDFNMRDNDYLVRYDGSRWRITAPQVSEITTGFGPTGTQVSPGAMFRVQLEDKTSVAYSIPIVEGPLATVGWTPYMLQPHANDVVNGPLTYNDFE